MNTREPLDLHIPTMPCVFIDNFAEEAEHQMKKIIVHHHLVKEDSSIVVSRVQHVLDGMQAILASPLDLTLENLLQEADLRGLTAVLRQDAGRADCYIGPDISANDLMAWCQSTASRLEREAASSPSEVRCTLIAPACYLRGIASVLACLGATFLTDLNLALYNYERDMQREEEKSQAEQAEQLGNLDAESDSPPF